MQRLFVIGLALLFVLPFMGQNLHARTLLLRQSLAAVRGQDDQERRVLRV
ncbi:MAG: hypothetical protein H0W99_11895, partial [Acidobacteria bacterium]|nr:hypothetical protein [Acidobacteriota bacterium]